jgi:hypothetical protein
MTHPQQVQQRRKTKPSSRARKQHACGRRLRTLLDEYAISCGGFAELLCISPKCLRNWFVRGVPRVRMEQLARMLSVSEVWLAKGEGERPGGVHIRPKEDPGG